MNRSAMAAGIFVVAASGAMADIGPVSVDGRLATINVEGEPPSQVFGGPERVFGEDLAFDAMAGVGAEAPGYASSLTNPILGATIQYNMIAALRAWDGSAFVGTSRTMSTGSDEAMLPFISTPATDVFTPAYAFFLEIDQHFDWLLDGATETTGQGVYLVTLSLTNPGGTLAESEPFWVVFNYGRPESEHEAAIEWVREVLVPAPGTGSVLIAGAALGRRSRRRTDGRM